VEDTKPLEHRLEDIERLFRRLEEEWTNVYDKFRTLQMRVAKQVQRLDENSSHEEPQEAGSNGNAGGVPTVSLLSPHQREVQKQILERRRRGNPELPGEIQRRVKEGGG